MLREEWKERVKKVWAGGWGRMRPHTPIAKASNRRRELGRELLV